MAPGSGAFQGLYRPAKQSTCINRSIPASSVLTASVSRFRSAPMRCTGSLKRGSLRIGVTKRAKTFQVSDIQRFAWFGSFSNGRRTCRIRRSFCTSLKEDLFSAGMYVFTPEGRSAELSEGFNRDRLRLSDPFGGGAPLLGCAGQRPVGLAEIHFRSGDTVEIITTQQQSPTRDWLKWVKTPRAKSKIRNWLKSQQRDRSRGAGARNSRRGLASLSARFSIVARQRQNRLGHQRAGNQRRGGFLAAIGYGRITTRQVLVKIVPPEKLDSGA